VQDKKYEKTVDTLIEDIFEVVEQGVEPDKEHVESFAKGIAESIADAIAQGVDKTDARKTLRMSAIGTPDRKLWYSLKSDYLPEEHFSAQQLIAFSYGHLIEQFIIFLARHAGHVVEDEQKEVELEGVKGHIDCVIDGVLIDCKGMSRFGYNKFIDGTFLKNDSFGYVDQLSGYAQALGVDNAGFLVFDKERAGLTLFMLDEFNLRDARARINHLKKILAEDTPPERCFQPIPKGTSGNLVLDKPCEWCPYKFECWKDTNNGEGLRVFKYSSGPTYFTHVEILPPRVDEITNGYKKKKRATRKEN
jgi:hypothetical protein